MINIDIFNFIFFVFVAMAGNFLVAYIVISLYNLIRKMLP